MKVVGSAIVLLASALCLVSAQNSPFGPLTTNNGISACVQYGSCTDGGSYATTETQNSPVRPPPTSVAYAPATNAEQSSLSIANLASTGAAAAYSSRIANGQGSGGNGNGFTAPIDTAKVIAGQAPISVASTNTDGSNAGMRIETSLSSSVWTMGMAVAAMALGGAVVL